MSSNATPWDERNSFAALQGPQVGLLKTLTFSVCSVMLPPDVKANPKKPCERLPGNL
jgi:hypothetical protein